jgi:hypothetical protein
MKLARERIFSDFEKGFTFFLRWLLLARLRNLVRTISLPVWKVWTKSHPRFSIDILRQFYQKAKTFFSIPCCLSLGYFRLEAPKYRNPSAWGPWLAYVPLCRLRVWEPIERITRPQPKHFTVKLYYRDKYWWLVTCCRFTSPLYKAMTF